MTERARTITIIDAYGSPTLAVDGRRFNSGLGSFRPRTSAITAPFGANATTPANASGWAGRDSLDVEWAHAIAPGAKIELVLAKSNDDADILAATSGRSTTTSATSISQSFGEAESCVDPTIAQQQHQVFRNATRKGMTLFASSGDQGAAQPNCDGNSGSSRRARRPTIRS